MKDENGEMAPDEDCEAVEISRGSRNREISGGVVGKLSGGRRLGEESLSGNFREDADSERKAFQETSWRMLNRKGKPFRKLSGVRPMKDENGEMAPDEDSEAVEISRGSRYRETAEIARQ